MNKFKGVSVVFGLAAVILVGTACGEETAAPGPATGEIVSLTVDCTTSYREQGSRFSKEVLTLSTAKPRGTADFGDLRFGGVLQWRTLRREQVAPRGCPNGRNRRRAIVAAIPDVQDRASAERIRWRPWIHWTGLRIPPDLAVRATVLVCSGLTRCTRPLRVPTISYTRSRRS
jgi:hypothetical protein